jgi:peptide/nickel transport system substrate-binding protein
MLRNKSLLFTIILTLLLMSLLAACGAPTVTTTQAPTSSAPATITAASATSTAAPTTTTSSSPAKPQGELIAGIQSYGNENWLPWLDPDMANLHDIVYDVLIYFDLPNHKFIPGLAESWEVSPDALTLTYHIRKGVQFSDGWGEFTAADVKYNFEMQASPKSVGKVAQTRRIASMDTPDQYTLVVHFKDPFPTFFAELSLGNSGVCQGMVSKKYLETVGEETASKKPVGTGPYRLVDSQTGSYFKLEAPDEHWRVVPEFKILTVRLIPETSTLVAALKTKEIDCSAQIPANQLADLKAAGLSTEVNPVGGTMIMAILGGMAIPEDKRYNSAIHNKDPWVDARVKKAMALAIDRAAIAKAIYAGYADPAGVPLLTADSKNYQYPYDPAVAKQLLKDAGYPNGFSFKVVSYNQPGYPESARIMEALAGYWQQIGLDPKIVVIDYNTYNNNYRSKLQTAGDVSFGAMAPVADILSRVELHLLPNVTTSYYQDPGSYAIYQEMPKNSTLEDRMTCADKLNKYYFDNIGPIPLVQAGYCFAWNSDKISPWPHPYSSRPVYFEYIRHAQPINTFRLFTPWPGR